jgi:O-acetyl-ADP-ribose deacetylase (regulator of RNase III)
MIRYTQGNLFDAQVDALVNTVNTVGVMGKGVALQFKERFPENFTAYAAACKRGEIEIGRMFVTETRRLTGPRWIVNFPTKKDWRHPSKMEYVRAGLVDLVRVTRELPIRSIAVPPLGAGSGGLDWWLVRGAIEDTLAELNDVDVLVFEPTAAYQADPKRAGVEELTAARAMLVDLIRRYSVVGFECTNLEVQKLAYFLQRVLVGMGLPDELRLDFGTHRYGPYADALRHLLNALDGSYLHCEKRLADAGPFDAIVIDGERLAKVREYLEVQLDRTFTMALDQVDRIIDGFQSPHLMELLASVDWIARPAGPRGVEEMAARLRSWPGPPTAGERKARLFKEPEIQLATSRLRAHAAVLYPHATDSA